MPAKTAIAEQHGGTAITAIPAGTPKSPDGINPTSSAIAAVSTHPAEYPSRAAIPAGTPTHKAGGIGTRGTAITPCPSVAVQQPAVAPQPAGPASRAAGSIDTRAAITAIAEKSSGPARTTGRVCGIAGRTASSVAPQQPAVTAATPWGRRVAAIADQWPPQ